MTLYGSAYFLSKKARMKMLVAPPLSVDAEACSATMSVSRIKAAAECSAGIETLTMTLESITASRSVHVPDSTRGNRQPLKNAAGRKVAFLSALYRCTFSFRVS